MENRFERGYKLLNQIDGEGGQKVIDSLVDIAPDIGNFIVEFAFVDIYSHGMLTLQERELITTISLLTSGDYEPQLEVHIKGVLKKL